MCQNAFLMALSNEGELTPASLCVRAKSGFQVSVERSLGGVFMHGAGHTFLTKQPLY